MVFDKENKTKQKQKHGKLRDVGFAPFSGQK